MKTRNLSEMVNGWIIGNFSPTLFPTNEVEVAVKRYKIGDCDKMHLHKIATEYTVIIKGRVIMNGVEYIEGDIIIIEPNEPTDFYAINDTITVVIKIPGANNDKFLCKKND